ncbi:serine palmitoyltransferase small subunit B [Xiphophorus couchianus]|nr:serine palmitoyltransferase small subunit B [Xiphophorus couchianus]
MSAECIHMRERGVDWRYRKQRSSRGDAGCSWSCCRGDNQGVPTDRAGRMSFKNMREYLAWLYYQYLLITGIYVLEPWEKSIFNSVLFSAIAMVVYTSYVFVPIHVHLALEFFSEIIDGQPESAMALMN